MAYFGCSKLFFFLQITWLTPHFPVFISRELHLWIWGLLIGFEAICKGIIFPLPAGTWLPPTQECSLLRPFPSPFLQDQLLSQVPRFCHPSTSYFFVPCCLNWIKVKLLLGQGKVLFYRVIHLWSRDVFSHYAIVLTTEHIPIEIKGCNLDAGPL